MDADRCPTGEQFDAETGFVYLRARYLDLGTGRFLSPDPISFAGGDFKMTHCHFPGQR